MSWESEVDIGFVRDQVSNTYPALYTGKAASSIVQDSRYGCAEIC